MIETFGQRLKRIRKEKGLKQSELADKINVDYPRMSNYERGKIKPSIATLKKMCVVLDVSASELLGF